MKIALFSDLDGTLLDHDTYDYAPAVPALSRLNRNQIPLILASSKTGSELLRLREQLQITQWPAIVENGGGVLDAGVARDAVGQHERELQGAVSNICETLEKSASAYTALRKVVKAGELGENFCGFGDLSAEEVAQITGLELNDAVRAKQRAFTEPGIFDGTGDEKRAFLNALSAHGIAGHDGGRFLTLSFGHTKADQLKAIAKALGTTVIIALGDAPNDREMLLAADYPVIVRNDHSPAMGDIPGALVTEQSGPTGWNHAVLSLLKKLTGE